MAASFTQKTTHTTGTADPTTVSVTTTANDHLLVLCLVVASATLRTGGDPTFNGVAMTQAGSTAQAASAPETSVEIWYMLNPPATTANVSIPNTGGLTLRRDVSCYKSSTGRFNYGSAGTNSGTSTNPSLSLSVPYDNSVWISAVGTGATTWAPSAQDGTNLYNTDHGANGMGSQYGIKATSGTQSMGWTEASNDDWAIVGVSFGVNPPTVALNSPADAGSTSDTTPDLAFTGTDTDGDDITYTIQVDTVNTFDSTTGSGPAHDVTVTGGGNGVNSFTFGALTTTGEYELLIATISYSNATPSGVTFSGGGLTWHQLTTRVAHNGNSANGYTDVYYTLTSTVLTSEVITATMTGGGFPQVSGVLSAYSGTDISGTDGSGAIGNIASTSGSTANPSQSVTTTRNNSLVIGCYGQSNNNTYTANSGETINGQVSGGGTVSRSGQQRKNAVTATSGTSVTEAITCAAANWAAFAVEIKASKDPLLTKKSNADAGFSGTPDNTDPFTSAQQVTYTVQSALSHGTYYWRVRGKDPNGSASQGAWSSTRSFLVGTSINISDSVSVTESVTVRLGSFVTVTDAAGATDSTNALADSYSETNQDATVNFNTGAGILGVGQSFTGNGGVLDAVKFYLKKAASPTGTAVAKVYAHSGVYGTSSVPTGAALATSDTINVADLTTSLALTTLTFSGANKITLTNGTNYFLSFETAAGDPTNQVTIGYDGSSPTHGGNYASTSGAWSADSARDVCFYLYVGAPTLSLEITTPSSGFAPSISDTTTVTESVTLLVSAPVAVSDTAGSSEALSAELVSVVSATDTSGTTEDLATVLVSLVSVTDTSTLSESVTLTLSDPQIAVSETVVTTDTPVMLLGSDLTVMDSTSVTEDLAPLLIAFLAVIDTTTITESAALLLTALPAVTDTSTLSESVTADLEANAAVEDTSVVSDTPALTLAYNVVVEDTSAAIDAPTLLLTAVIAVTDTSSIAEASQVNPVVFVAVEDTTTLTESSIVIVGAQADLTVAVTDSLASVDTPALLLASDVVVTDTSGTAEASQFTATSFVVVEDTTPLTESLNPALTHNTTISDNTTVTEATTTLTISPVDVTDSATISETTTLLVTSFTSTQDTTTLSESATPLLVALVEAADSAAVADTSSATITAPVAVSESATASEAVALLLTGFVATTDMTTLAEAVTAQQVSDAAVSDSATVAEAVALTLVSLVATDTAITVSEASTLLTLAFVAVSDSATVAEAVAVAVVAADALTVTVQDTSTLSESVTPLLENLIAITDSATLADTPVVLLEPQVTTAESATVAEAVTLLTTAPIAVSETLTVAEATVAILADPQVAVSDNAPLTEATTVSLQTPANADLAIIVSDTIGPYRLIFVDGRPALRAAGRFYILL